MYDMQQCEYNNGCEDYAQDGSWKRWAWNVTKCAPAHHEVSFVDKIENVERTYQVCDGCLSDILFQCDNHPETHELLEDKRIQPQTKSYEGKRGTSGLSCVFQAETQEQREETLKAIFKHTTPTVNSSTSLINQNEVIEI